MIKRIYESENNELVKCFSDNKEYYSAFDIPKSDIKSLSLVVGLIRAE